MRREIAVGVATAIVFVYFGVSQPSFLTTANLDNAWPYFAPLAILAAGEVPLMIDGEIDLSIGGVYLFAPYLYYELAAAGHVPLLLSLAIAVAAAAGIGLANGLATAVMGVPSFVVTLGTLFTLEGLAVVLAGPQLIATPGSPQAGPGGAVGPFASVFGAGTYSELAWAGAVVIVLHVALTRTRWGLHTVAAGFDAVAAAQAGVRVRRVVIRNFVLCSTLAGLVGVLEAVRTSSIAPDPVGANVVLLQAIAAAVIGGTLLAGGSGTVIGAMLGALFLGILQDGLAIEGVSASDLDLWLGLMILAAITVSALAARARRRPGAG